ncbi:uncharacterized protein LOC110683747 [Chenopodium quinoa]|uniref:Acid phosphatase/vanadium-dependent haloperoxidase-related protein n=1 Tax=Chenopodium quinoa TaxID=63459 RepID=A0A803MER7_CHEQI|nr:uncharacterized protein LOC110683747 [Chenopodium quinoa]
MSVNCCFLPNTSNPRTPISFLRQNRKKPNLGHFHFPLNSSYSPPKFTCHLSIGFDDILTITQNKVLIAAGVSAAIGQLAKPFTSVLLYGKNFDIKAVIQAGGFPSTHSSAVVAAATSLALDRGFSDSIFGMSVVYAGLVMYDAQGVRREVGIHARTLNRLLMEDQIKSVMKDNEEIRNSVPEKSSATNIKSSRFLEEPNTFSKEPTTATQLLGSRLLNSTAERGKKLEKTNSNIALKESIGHTEVEVIAGALWGFLVTLTVYAIM